MPKDAELFSFTTALQRYARTVALANLGRIVDAKAEFDLFHLVRAAVQENRYMFNSPAANVLVIAEQMAKGELSYKSGHINEGLDHLRNAVVAPDELLYDEPWGWMQCRVTVGLSCHRVVYVTWKFRIMPLSSCSRMWQWYKK